MKNKHLKVLQFTTIFEPAEEGGYTVIVPALEGCITEGDTFEEALSNAKDAIKCYVESLKKHGEPIPQEEKETIVSKITVPIYA